MMSYNCNNDVWHTLYEKEFDTNKYLYHYTSFSTGVKILIGNSLKFSALNKLNDTLESKPKMIFDNEESSSYEKLSKMIDETSELKLQLICFSQDNDKFEKSPRVQSDYLASHSDYTGRGFALPRMWAQYAQNNSGICFIFDREKLAQKITDYLGSSLIHHTKVDYVSQYDTVIEDDRDVQILLENYSKASLSSKISKAKDFLKSNENFTKYNYFSKFEDWAGEHEYRFLAIGDEEFLVTDIQDAISGIVIGERMNDAEIEVFKRLSDGICEIARIKFTCKGFLLDTI